MNLELQPLIDSTDDDFDAIYPDHIRQLARKHWTPISVAKAAAQFLVSRRGIKVLDIGSGVGKFCMVGAALTHGHFTGVEQRSELVELSRMLSASYGLTNTNYINANIISIDFRDYNGFYLYNSFFENMDPRNSIDKTISLSAGFYTTYGAHTSNKLSSLPSGVRLATYFTDEWIVPTNFELIDTLFKGNLKLWEKMY
ncbi:class I SAM-dependent methyltransferase [Fulvivirgaceae bacterium PWU5]|uniref:Class I SAM-dependent methyltransferase n=1 Tax=Dawidia cretensis TaxID=2782350 RepID=A0AAP2E103_9BACT|nr:class I SAM-dependent methyltransferase [Dawidia cretensis]MBT1710770.1 class I SAM-dependent methyltransferase [Dawidia cretensis]